MFTSAIALNQKPDYTGLWQVGMRKKPLSTKQVFLWVMVLSVVFMFLPSRLTDRVGNLLTQVLSPLTGGVRDLTLSVTDKLDFRPQRSGSSKTIDQLKAKIQRQENERIHLERELQRFRERISQLTGLRQQFGLSQASFILADVVGSDTKRRREFLNQGSSNGVKSGQMVLALPHSDSGDRFDQEAVYQMCVVGQIDDVLSNSSHLRLLSDRGFSLPVIVEPARHRGQSWRADGNLQGQAMGEIAVTMIEVKGYDIEVGDRVLACSSPRRLPIEMIIGHVQFCQPDKDNPVLWHIVVEPMMDLHTLQNVVVVDTQWE